MSQSLALIDVLEEMFYRDLLEPESDGYQQFVWQKHGALGEAECLEWLLKELPEGVALFSDVEVEFNGRTQVDLLLLADEFWWVIEVKNYRGVFKYHDQVCELNGRPMQSDQIAAMRNRLRIMRELAHQIDPLIQVAGSMIFIHPEGEAVVECKEGFSIVMRHQLNRHIYDIRAKFKLHRNRHALAYFNKIKEHSFHYPVELPVLSSEDWMRMKKGCRCIKCQSYKLKARHKNMVCLDCGHVMSKSQLAIDIYCQACVLTHDQENGVTVSKMVELSGGELSRSVIYKTLKPYVEVNNKYKHSYFTNHHLPKDKLNHIFMNRYV